MSTCGRAVVEKDACEAGLLPRQLNQVSGHHDALDLTRTLDDVHGLDVPKQFFDQVISPSTDFAEQLHAEARGFEGDCRGRRLGHRGFDDIGLAVVGEPGGPPAQQTRRAKTAPDAFESIANPGKTEKIVFARESQGLVERCATDSNCHDRDEWARRIERTHGSLESRPPGVVLFAADQILVGNPAIPQRE